MACIAFAGLSATGGVAHCVFCVLRRHCHGCGRRLHWVLQKGTLASRRWTWGWSGQELGRSRSPRLGSRRRLLGSLGSAGSSALGLGGIHHYHAGRWEGCWRVGWQRLVQHTRNMVCAIWTWRSNGHWCGQWSAHLATQSQAQRVHCWRHQTSETCPFPANST